MCGLVGVAGKVGISEEKAFNRLLQIDTIRGPHSTGVLSVQTGKHAEPTYIKKLGTPWELYQYKAWDDLFRKDHAVLMGHNRWATKGAINAINAHPFEHGSVIGAHNGTLRKQYLLDDSREFEVDSDNIYHHLNKNGVDDTVEKLDGAFALSWWDKDKDTLNFVRNNERPLFWCLSLDGQTVFWASENWMLITALSHAGIKHGKIKAFKELHHYSMAVPRTGIYGKKEALPKWRVKEQKAYVAPTVVTFPSQQNNWKGNGNTYQGNNIQKKQQVSVTDMNRYIGQTLDFYIDGEGDFGAGSPFLTGSLANNYVQEVRIFVEMGSDKWKELNNTATRFRGKVQGYSTQGYLTINLKSIEVSGGLTYGGKKFYDGWNGVSLSEEQWHKKMQLGCSWCSDVPVPNQADDIHWFSDNEFICPSCVETPEVKQYLNL